MQIRLICTLVVFLLPWLAATAAAPFAPPTTDEVQAVREHGRYLATITLTDGNTIELVLEGAYMPYTVANFVKLARANYFDQQEFLLAEHRKHADGSTMGFASGGDPTGAGPGYTLPLEFSPYLIKHTAGVVSMWRKSNTTSSAGQFIITTGAMPMFDGSFPIFGWLKSGKEAVIGIARGDRMQSVTVAPYAGQEACPVLTPAPTPGQNQPPTQAEVDAVRAQGRYLATITLENGRKIILVLEGNVMPITVANFVKLAQTGYYNGLTFHRVEEGEGFQLIQGGDPMGNGGGGPGYEIRREKSDLIHKAGALGMARSEAPDSAGSQFYIVGCDIPGLDGNYAVFGWVKEGLELINTVKRGDKMQSVTIAPYAGTEPCPVKSVP